MDSASWKIAHEMLANCCGSLFAGLGVETVGIANSEPNPPRAGERLATFVGFSGNDLRGSVSLDLPISLVARLHPLAASSEPIGKEDLCDWAGELANQLLGRLKNTLSRYGVTLQMSTPSTVWGEMSHGKKARSEASAELHFAAGEHRIVVYFDGLALVPVDLTKPPAAEEDESPAEGDMMMLL